MNTVTVKTSELGGVSLDWAIAEATREEVVLAHGEVRQWVGDRFVRFSPSKDWSQSGPLIEKYRVEIGFCGDDNLYFPGEWYAQLDEDGFCHQTHRSPLIAAMRAIIQADLGDTVEIPEELVK